MSSNEPKDDRPLPPLLAHLVESAKAAGESRYATALALFGHQAVGFIPSHQNLRLPDSPNIDDAMKGIAAQHLGSPILNDDLKVFLNATLHQRVAIALSRP